MQRRGADLGRPPVSRLAKFAVLPVVAAVTLALVPAGPVSAEPRPSRKELTAQQKKLANEAEQLSEQYNGLRVRLEQAERAAKAEKGNAQRQRAALEEVRTKIARLAAESYKNGVTDQTIAFATSDAPQRILDRSATFNYFAQQDSAEITLLLQALQRSERSHKAAKARQAEVEELTAKAKGKRRDLQTKLKKVERKLGGLSGPAKPGAIPNVDAAGASAKAMRAVNAALSQRGTPYSWGGGNASGPSYGTAQGANIKGFDCSGLTLYAYAQVGITLPHYTGSQFTAGTRVSRSQLVPGDLVFFYSDLHHMGMYIGDGKMVHAPQTGDVVKISSISGRPFAGGVRVA